MGQQCRVVSVGVPDVQRGASPFEFSFNRTAGGNHLGVWYPLGEVLCVTLAEAAEADYADADFFVGHLCLLVLLVRDRAPLVSAGKYAEYSAINRHIRRGPWFLR